MSEQDYSSEAAQGYAIEDEAPERRYFTQVPNMVFDLPISREAKWLYVHLKRVAGDSGECYQSLNTLAKRTQTSKPTLIKAKQELIGQGLIRVRPAERGDKPDTITIRNVWRRNIDHFDRVVKEKTTPVFSFTTPGKGENRKKNPGKEEPIKKSGNSEKEEKKATSGSSTGEAFTRSWRHRRGWFRPEQS